MNGTFCIDKRIGYLTLFAVPLMVLTVLSLIINSQKVTQNSRAETPAATSFVTALSPTLVPSSSTCLTIVGGEWNIPKNVNNEIPLQVYGLKENRVFYLALLNLITPQKETSAKGYEAYLGIQGSGIKYPISDDFKNCFR